MSETDDGLVYVVAEFLTGELLSETLARRGALSLEDAVDICLQAAAGLQAAHEIGWVHGRLSPDTILVTRTIGDRPLVKLIGFSQDPFLRRDAEPPIDQGVSLRYASPERMAGGPLDERGDVYSLGAVLHHLLTGVPPTSPLKGGAGPEAMRRVLLRALAPSPGGTLSDDGGIHGGTRSARSSRWSTHFPNPPGLVGANFSGICGPNNASLRPSWSRCSPASGCSGSRTGPGSTHRAAPACEESGVRSTTRARFHILVICIIVLGASSC